MATLVARAAPPQEVFAAVAEEVGRLLAADFAILVRYDPADSWRSSARGPARARRRRPRSARGCRSAGGTSTTLVYQTGRPARIDDYDDAVSGAIGQVAARDWGLRSSVGVPVSVEGRLWGAMVVAFTRREPLPADTEARLAGFTELVATAIANAGAQAEVTASRARIVAAADQARRRIERDLHDGAQQRLVTLALQLRAAQAAVPPELGAGANSTTPSPRRPARWRSCARSPAASTRRSWPSGGLRPALKRSPAARRSPSTCRYAPTSGCPSRSRSAPTTSSPRR